MRPVGRARGAGDDGATRELGAARRPAHAELLELALRCRPADAPRELGDVLIALLGHELGAPLGSRGGASGTRDRSSVFGWAGHAISYCTCRANGYRSSRPSAIAYLGIIAIYDTTQKGIGKRGHQATSDP